MEKYFSEKGNGEKKSMRKVYCWGRGFSPLEVCFISYPTFNPLSANALPGKQKARM